jgi:hypothetical protein
METNLEILFVECNTKYKKSLNSDIKMFVEKFFGENFDIQYDTRLEKRKTYVYIGLNKNYLTEVNKEKLVELSKKIAALVKPTRTVGDFEYVIDKQYEDVKAIFWLNIFNLSQVKEFTEEKLLSAPAYKVEKLDDGSILLVLYKDPWTSDGDEKQERREKVRAHLFG